MNLTIQTFNKPVFLILGQIINPLQTLLISFWIQTTLPWKLPLTYFCILTYYSNLCSPLLSSEDIDGLCMWTTPMTRLWWTKLKLNKEKLCRPASDYSTLSHMISFMSSTPCSTIWVSIYFTTWFGSGKLLMLHSDSQLMVLFMLSDKS